MFKSMVSKWCAAAFVLVATNVLAYAEFDHPAPVLPGYLGLEANSEIAQITTSLTESVCTLAIFGAVKL